MRNEDLEKKIIQHSKKEYYQTIDTIKIRVQKIIRSTKFTRDPFKNREILADVLLKVMSGYEKQKFIEKYQGFFMLAEESGDYKGMLVIHMKGYSTFSVHFFTITRGNKIFTWD